MSTRIREARPFAEAATPSAKPGKGRILVRLVDAGRGSSGVYPAETLQAAAEARVFPAGTLMFIDHPTESDEWERPERSVRDLAAVLIEDARFDAGTQALVAEADVYSAWRQPIADMAGDIGVSIRALAEAEQGEWEGAPALIITKLTEGLSVDFVTYAGRGGKVLEVLESRATARAVRRGVAEATANDRREQLSDAVRSAYGSRDANTWAWVRDFDEALVWFEVETPDGMATWQQSYTPAENDMSVQLTGERIEVRPTTTYVPVNPAGQSTTTQESEEDTMPQIEEARLRQLEEDAGRVTTLTTERDTAVTRAEVAEKALAAIENRGKLRPVVTKVIGESEAIPVTLRDQLVASVVEGFDGTTTEAQATEAATAALKAKETEVAAIAEMLGAGSVRGLGGSTTTGDVPSQADVDEAAARAFGHTIKEA
ncbi:hypothetical protein OEB99_16565 [Actinotalea sp. M2MS4P-6]|uniref:hypothetical protein n=1 Tax=Actinotalea sp. M2MS4P-6 TaxID=2983762 RepID=UPI0021E3D2FB|nr:hypothetical protein [Actinotalea sp. M2MS4P-6]MCV2395930.1 hypothetical protein [Actinotalea sp. M2MS4P-6]